ncbi:MAG TPA: hypothetical protein DCM23_02930 [Firmicutes bacterium]|jgi:hypothetical protein|nr:hypothetical protein [Bacillota bacterium]HAV19565.1 hypothetical protein [Bacillota bacterium]
MANVAVALSVLLIMLEAFQFGQRFSVVKRTFYSLSPHVIESCIAFPGFNNQSEEPFFDKDLMRENIPIYLKDNMIPTIETFQVSFYYFELENNMICHSDYCQGVTINLIVPITGWFDYEEQLSFEIKEVL